MPGAFADFSSHAVEVGAQRRDALAGDGSDRKERGLGQRRAGQQVGNFSLCLRQAFGRYRIDLGQGHRALADAEQFDDVQVLAGLRHGAIVGGDDEQRKVDAGGTGQHVVDQLLVAGHVDEAERTARRERGVGVAEIERDATRLLFLQSVAVDTGEGFDQGGLAVVDVAGGADDHGVRLPGRGWRLRPGRRRR